MRGRTLIFVVRSGFLEMFVAFPSGTRGDGEYVRHRRAQRKAFAARHRRLHLWFLASPFASLGFVLLGRSLAVSLPSAIAYGAYVAAVGAALLFYLGTLAYRGWLRLREDRVSLDLAVALALAPLVPFLTAALLWLNDPAVRDDPASSPFHVVRIFPWAFVAWTMGVLLVAAYRDYTRYQRLHKAPMG